MITYKADQSYRVSSGPLSFVILSARGFYTEAETGCHAARLKEMSRHAPKLGRTGEPQTSRKTLGL